MTIKRLLGLEVLLLVGLGSVFLLPKGVALQPAAIDLTLPEFVGSWYGTEQPISQGERDSLGPDTEFARKLYTNGSGDQLFVSVVLSGPDMNTSIHRPERCLPAQGWTVTDTKTTTLPTPDGEFEATRLHNMRTVRLDSDRTANIYNLNYYWFVGSTQTTASHTTRTLIDIRDRVLRGSNQRWAYVTVAATVTEGIRPFGRSEQETDRIIREFIGALVPAISNSPSQPHVAAAAKR
jgi:EpsI family protein